MTQQQRHSSAALPRLEVACERYEVHKRREEGENAGG